jgi:hypothetical protein
MKTKAEQALEFINNAKSLGKTVYISTHLKAIKITPKTFEKFNAAKRDLFVIDKAGDLRISSGKNYNVIVTKNVSLVTITAV